jgi:hypothetical protein
LKVCDIQRSFLFTLKNMVEGEIYIERRRTPSGECSEGPRLSLPQRVFSGEAADLWGYFHVKETEANVFVPQKKWTNTQNLSQFPSLPQNLMEQVRSYT